MQPCLLGEKSPEVTGMHARCVCDITKGSSTEWILSHSYTSKKKVKQKLNNRQRAQAKGKAGKTKSCKDDEVSKCTGNSGMQKKTTACESLRRKL